MLSNKMVATRRGTRVSSPARQTEREVTEPTLTIRRTRRRTVIVTNQPQNEQTSDSQQDDTEEQNTVPTEPANPSKRETRRSKRHPATANQADFVHEADVSESESCCSVASDVLVQSTTRGRSRRRTANREKPTAATEQEVSEGESYSSAPASKPYRSTSSRKKPASVQEESATSRDNDQSEAESCGSITSLSKVTETQMITRSRRRIAVLPEDAEPSEADSCSSAMSALQSTVRRSMRSRKTKPIEPIPIHLEESEPAGASASSASTRIKECKAKVKSPDEDQTYDSEGCRSGPSSSPQRNTGRVVVLDSDSESTYISLDSPCSLRVRLTPCSSRTGSASSICASRTRSKVAVTQDVSVPSEASKGEKLDSIVGKHEKKMTEIPMDMTCQSENAAPSDIEDVEEVHEETNKTVISADDKQCSILEDINGDLTLTLDEDDVNSSGVEAKMLEPESRQETSSISVSISENTENIGENHIAEDQAETEKGVQVIEEHEKTLQAELMQEAHDVDDHASAVEMKPEKHVQVIEEDAPSLMEVPNTENEQCSGSIGTGSVIVVDESEEKVETMKKAELVAGEVSIVVENVFLKPLELDEKGVKVTEEGGESEAEEIIDVAQVVSASQTVSVIDRDPSEQTVEDEEAMEVEEHHDMDADPHESEQQSRVQDVGPAEKEEEGPSSSSDIQTKSQKVVLSLLDSSEDEESDNECLSDDVGKEDDGGLDSENEVMCSAENQPGSSKELNSLHDNDLFVIDTRPGLQPSEEYYIDTKQQKEEADYKPIEDEEDYIDEEGDDEDDDLKVLFTTRRPASTALSSAIDPGLKVKELGGLYISFDGSKSKSVSNNLKKLKDQKNQDELMKNSVIVADFEKKDAVPPYRESKHAAKLKRKEEKSKTTGDGWFNMKAPELTEELKNDLKALKMRSAVDPKRFYKKNDREGFPKYFQVGTVVDNPADFYHSRVPKKQRKKTMVEELLADAEFRSFNKRKYQEIMAEKAAEAAGKKNKKHKFHKMK